MFTSLLKDMSKDTDEQTNEEIGRVRCGSVPRVGVCHPSDTQRSLPTWKLFEPILLGFCGGMINQFHFQSPLPSLEQGYRTKSSKPLIKWLVPLATNPHPQVLSKSHSINLKKYTFISLITGNSKCFRSSVPGIGMMTKYFIQIFIINYNITPIVSVA